MFHLGLERPGYGIIGFRLNRNMKGISKFVFRHGVNLDTPQKRMNDVSKPFRPFVRTKYLVMKQVLGRTCLNEVGGQAKSFSTGKTISYSRCHIYSDMYYTMLTVCGPSCVEDDKVIYYISHSQNIKSKFS